MTIRAGIWLTLNGSAAVIAAGAADQIYHMQAPENPTFPYVVINQISGERVHASQGGGWTDEARTPVVRGRFQIDIWSEDVITLDTLATGVRLALDGKQRESISGVQWQGTFLEGDLDRVVGPADGSDVPTFGKSYDFLIWYEEST